MLNERKIKSCNVTYTSPVLVGSVVVVLQW